MVWRKNYGYGSKIQDRLEDLLAEHGIVNCDAWNIARGWWLSPQADVMRWQCYAMYQGRRQHVGSWNSMTECVRYGVKVAKGSEAGGYVDVDVMALAPNNIIEKKK